MKGKGKGEEEAVVMKVAMGTIESSPLPGG